MFNIVKTIENIIMNLPLKTISLVAYVGAFLLLMGCASSANLLWAADEPAREDTKETQKAFKATLNNSPIRSFRVKNPVNAEVVRVLDGSTIEVAVGDEHILVGYIGIETPHYEHVVLGSEPFGREAIDRNKQLVEGKTVILEEDTTKRDRDGRELRYVYVDGIMVNSVLVHEGLAQLETYAIGLKYNDLLYELQNQAIVERKGGWRNTWRNVIPFR